MRVFVGFFSLSLLCLLTSLSSAANDSGKTFTIRVVDPQGIAVSGAEVSLLSADGKVLAAQTSSAEGLAILSGNSAGTYQIKVLAPGFAEENIRNPEREVTVRLHVATASETVVVSATRTPVLGEAAGADVTTLTGGQLTTMQVIAANDAVRFLPGAVINTAGQTGGLASLFVRGGESNYNKVIVDGVTIDEPGGTFDFGTLSLAAADRLEFLRGAQSTLYGSDAMTSVVQVWTRTGSAAIPELSLAADGGNFRTASGHASLAGSRGIFDYNIFGDQFNTNGFGVNDAYSDSLAGVNFGAQVDKKTALRVRVRHSNSHTDLPGEWNFNSYVPLVPANGPTEPLVPLQPNPNAWSQLNDLLGSVELTAAAPSRWQHQLTGFDYLYHYSDMDPGDPARVDPYGDPIDYASHEVDHINRGGFEYQGDYSEKAWAHTTFGYRIENENGFVGDLDYPPQTHGQRLNNDFYAEQQVVWKSLTIIAGGRFVHDSAFGSTGVPRVALTWQALGDSGIFSGTRLRFSYATGFKEPRLEETFAGPPYTQPNPALKPERLRAFEAGFQQGFVRNKYQLNATYFNNLFHDQINYVTVNPVTFVGQYVNVNKAFAQGAEVVFEAKLGQRLMLNTAYTYTSSEYLDNPAPYDAVYDPGQPLLRRPKHSATEMLSYGGTRWGANLGGSFVGRRADSDFYGFGINHAAGYALVAPSAWYAINHHVSTYVTISNALDRRYHEVVGYPSLPVNFRAGLRLRFGGE
jgi:vitamin B12 transporter